MLINFSHLPPLDGSWDTGLRGKKLSLIIHSHNNSTDAVPQLHHIEID